MNIQYNKNKQDLKSDPLVEFLAATKQFVIAHSNSVLVVALAALIGLGALYTYQAMRRNSIRRAQDSFGVAMMAYTSGDEQKAVQALTAVEQNHPGTPQAAYSSFLLGQMLLRDGRYDEAITHLEIARKHAGKTLIAGKATEALAVCYEAKGDTDRAIELFSRLLTDESVRYRRPAIRWKLALLTKEMQQFDKAQRYCRDIVGDSLGTEYRQKAENLLAEIGALRGS